MERKHYISGFTILGIITLVLIILKAFGFIGLSWFWVFMPIIFPLVIVLFFLGFLVWFFTSIISSL